MESLKREIWRKMIMQQLGLTKLIILCQIKPNSLPKECRYSKILRNKLILVALAAILDFTPWNFVPMEIWGTAKLNFPYLVSLAQIRYQNLALRKWSQILKNIPPLVDTDPSTIKLVPNCYKTQKSVLKLLILDLIVFDSVRDQYKNQEMCNKSVSYTKILSWWI